MVEAGDVVRRRAVSALLGLVVGTGFVSVAEGQEARQPFANGDAALHRKVLTQRIDQLLVGQTAAEVIGVTDVVLGTTLAAVTASSVHDEPAASITFLVGFGAVDAAAVTSLFLSRDTRTRVFQLIIPTVPAVATLGFAVAHDPYPFPRLTAGSVAAGFFTSALVGAINDFSTPTPYSKLRAHQRRLENEQDLSVEERRAMHRDVLGARGPIPRWVYGTPMLIAGAVAISPAFGHRYSETEKTWAGLLGGASLASGLLWFFPHIVTRYEDDLETFDISVAFAPGGFQARGSFTAL